MYNNAKEINIEKIMGGIKENIKKCGYSDKMLSFEIMNEKNDYYELNDILQKTKGLCEISYYNPIPKKGAKNFVKRIIRKIMSFLLWPMNQQQNLFNSCVVMTLECLSEQRDIHTNNSISKEGQEQFLEYHEKMAEMLETKVLLLEQKVQKLEQQLFEKENV